jgi:hypothetical protein
MPARPLSPPPMEVQFLDDTGRPNKRWLDWLLDLFNSDQIGDGDSFQRLKLSNLLAPSAPFNGDNEQWSDTDLVPEGWTKQYLTNGSAVGVTDIRLLRNYYRRSTDSFRGNYAQQFSTPADVTTGVMRAARPEECKEFLSYEVSLRAKIDHRPAGNHGYRIEVDWFSDDSSLARGGSGFLSSSVVQAGAAAPFLADNTYQAFSGTVSAPSGAKFARIVEGSWGPNKGSASATTITSDTCVWRLKTINTSNLVGASTAGPTNNSSAAFVDIPEMTITQTMRGSLVAVIFIGTFQSNTANSYVDLLLKRDGTLLTTTYFLGFPAANLPYPVCLVGFDNPPAGSHTYKAQWQLDPASPAATITGVGISRQLQIAELP